MSIYIFFTQKAIFELLKNVLETDILVTKNIYDKQARRRSNTRIYLASQEPFLARLVCSSEDPIEPSIECQKVEV